MTAIPPLRVAVFVSPHGYGHAARACAVSNALARRCAGLQLEVFTTVPEWFFTESLDVPFRYHRCESDVGMVQRDSLREDAAATSARVASYAAFDEADLEPAADVVHRTGCRAVLCDISPLGLVAAGRVGLPSVLVENFTWDWVYRAYLEEAPALAAVSDALAGVFASATVRVQARPVCVAVPGATVVAPVARSPRTSRGTVRRRLGIAEDRAMVLVSMGGVGWDHRNLHRLADVGADVVVPGGGARASRRDHLVLLPHHSSFYHPDLVAAADAVVAKLGYSTVAEVAAAGLPLGYVPRPRFPESPVLEAFVRASLPSLEVPVASFDTGDLADLARGLLALPRRRPQRLTGADEAAAAVAAVL